MKKYLIFFSILTIFFTACRSTRLAKTSQKETHDNTEVKKADTSASVKDNTVEVKKVDSTYHETTTYYFSQKKQPDAEPGNETPAVNQQDAEDSGNNIFNFNGNRQLKKSGYPEKTHAGTMRSLYIDDRSGFYRNPNNAVRDLKLDSMKVDKYGSVNRSDSGAQQHIQNTASNKSDSSHDKGDSSKTTKDKETHGGGVAGWLIALIVFLALLIALLIYLYKKGKLTLIIIFIMVSVKCFSQTKACPAGQTYVPSIATTSLVIIADTCYADSIAKKIFTKFNKSLCEETGFLESDGRYMWSNVHTWSDTFGCASVETYEKLVKKKWVKISRAQYEQETGMQTFYIDTTIVHIKPNSL